MSCTRGGKRKLDGGKYIARRVRGDSRASQLRTFCCGLVFLSNNFPILTLLPEKAKEPKESRRANIVLNWQINVSEQQSSFKVTTVSYVARRK